MHTFPNGLADQKIKGFLSGFTSEEIQSENPETRDQIFNQILIEEVKEKEQKKRSQSWLRKILRSIGI